MSSTHTQHNVIATTVEAKCTFCVSIILKSDKYGGVEAYTDKAIKDHASIERGGLLLIALMSGADYDVSRRLLQLAVYAHNLIQSGLPGFTVEIAHRLTQYGLGRSLLSAAKRLRFAEFMEFHAKWRRQLCDVLERDPQHRLGRTYYELACVIEEERTEFPNPAVLATYLLPLTSWSDGGQPPVSVVTSRQPDLAAVAAFGSQCLGWPPEILQQKLTEACAGTVIRAFLQVRALYSCLLVLPSVLVTRQFR